MKTFIVYIACRPSQRAALLALLLALVLSACSQNTRPAADLTPEQQVAQRAEQRWQLIMQGDLLAAYEYLTPGYRARVSQRAYVNRVFSSGIEYTDVTVKDSNCDSNDRCTLRTVVNFTFRGALRGVDKIQSDAVISETWINLDEQWYYVAGD